MHVVAEKVETVAQADCLRSMGCDEMQGYLLSRPLPPAQLRAWLAERRVGGHLLHDEEPMTRFDLRTLDLDVQTVPGGGI
jgi:predicted signal transduction protein with EAL and GGDEF domain